VQHPHKHIVAVFGADMGQDELMPPLTGARTTWAMRGEGSEMTAAQ
jgi:hypothetical protein